MAEHDWDRRLALFAPQSLVDFPTGHKSVRDALTPVRTGWGLKKAKDYVDTLERSLLPRSAGMSHVPDALNKRMIDKSEI